MTNHHQDRLALLALVVGAIGIAFAPVLAKQAVILDGKVDGEILSPAVVAFWRMLIAAPLFVGLACARSKPRALLPIVKSHGIWMLIPGLMFALDLGLWHWAFEYTSVANATMEVNFSVILVSLASWWLFGERFTPLFVAGALLALAGMVELVGASFAQGGDAWIGDLMGLGVAFAYTGYQLTTKHAVKLLPVNLLMAGSSASAALFLGIGSALSPGRFVPVTREAWLTVGALALTSQVLGQGLIAYAMRRLPSSFTSVVLVLQPVGAAILGWIILGQPLSTSQIIGGSIVLLGICLARLGSGRSRRDGRLSAEAPGST
jgi:drug/metabolite transporter (DMT)-like permease